MERLIPHAAGERVKVTRILGSVAVARPAPSAETLVCAIVEPVEGANVRRQAAVLFDKKVRRRHTHMKATALFEADASGATAPDEDPVRARALDLCFPQNAG